MDGKKKTERDDTGGWFLTAGAAPLSELDLSDGFLFGEVMRDEETCRTVLEIILGRPVSRVVYANKEQQVEAGTGYHRYKGIRLDVYFRDEESTCYSVEMQTRNRYNLPKRSRHYQGMMDVQMLPAGEIDYNKLCDSILIFICTFDLFGEGKLCYTFENTCTELPGLKLHDGAVKIFLNTAGRGETERDGLLAEFLRYVSDHNAPTESPEVKQIRKRVEEVKKNQETEARYMTSITYAREVYEDGRMEGKADMVLEFLNELGDIPERIRTEICRETDTERLTRWVKLAARSGSVREFEEKMHLDLSALQESN